MHEHAHCVPHIVPGFLRKAGDQGDGGRNPDALGSREAKPWGDAFSRAQLWTVAIATVVAAYAIGIWYMVRYTPLLWLIAIPEGFFLLAYNLEWFGGRFHRDSWFALSWGALPVLAGYILQTNAISASALLMALAMGLLSLVEIKASVAAGARTAAMEAAVGRSAPAP